MSEKASRALKTFARLGVTLAVLWLIFVHIDWAVVLSLLLRADPMRLALAGIVLSVQFVIMVWRWQLAIELLGGGRAAGGPLAIALGRSMLIGQPLPSTLGGDAVRIVMLSRNTGVALAARSVICDRITALAMLVALVVVTLPFFAWQVEAGPAFLALAAVSLGSAATFLLFLAWPRSVRALPWLGRHAASVSTVAAIRRFMQLSIGETLICSRGTGRSKAYPVAPLAMSSISFAGATGACAMCTPNGDSASSIAEMIAAVAGMTPTSPTPLTPSGLCGDGDSL